jgi:AraC family transcriptional regulator, exoenzyme S synthesis regulatory protein ExsA
LIFFISKASLTIQAAIKIMNQYNVPEYFIGEGKKIPSAFILPYYTNKSTTKNKVLLTTHVFIFLGEGSKEIVMGNNSIKLEKNEFALVTAGRSFMSEKLSNEGHYSTTLLFFDNELLQKFFEAQINKIQEILRRNTLFPKETLLFKHDDFTKFYSQSLKYITNRSEELVKVKLCEILLYLMESQPIEFCRLFAGSPKTSEEIKFKNMIASHIDSNISIGELAYLCNVSLSTFKRRFTEIFNDTPTNWMRQKRMEYAAFLLKYNKERVSDIYLRLGYDNHSSFSQSFKNVFGISPKQYQLTS